MRKSIYSRVQVQPSFVLIIRVDLGVKKYNNDFNQFLHGLCTRIYYMQKLHRNETRSAAAKNTPLPQLGQYDPLLTLAA